MRAGPVVKEANAVQVPPALGYGLMLSSIDLSISKLGSNTPPNSAVDVTCENRLTAIKLKLMNFNPDLSIYFLRFK